MSTAFICIMLLSVIQLGTVSKDICPPLSQIDLKNFMKSTCSLIIKEWLEEILIKLAIVLKISKSSWNTLLCVALYWIIALLFKKK